MKINKNKQFWIFSLIAISIYAIAWLSLAWPYRPFPCDDIWFFHRGDGAHHPLFIFSLTVVKWFLSAFSADEFSYFLVHGILSNSLSLFLLSAIVFRLIQNRVLVMLSLLLYGTSAWPANYYFMASYTPWATMLSLLILLLIIEAYLRYSDSITTSDHHREKNTSINTFLSKRHEPFLIFAGIVAGLFFLTSTSALLMIGLQIVMIGYLFSQTSFLSGLKNAGIVLAILLLFIILSLLLLETHAIGSHWYQNIHTYHYTDALAKFGYVPKPPFFTLFYIGYTYHPILSIVFVIVSGITLASFAFKFYKKSKFSAFEKVLISLIVVIYAHAIAIDILPFTKLARTHFPVYPLIIMVLVISTHHLISHTTHYLTRLKPYLIALTLTACAFIITSNITFAKEMIQVRKYPADYLTSLPVTQLYLLNQDSHADFIKIWLFGLPIKKVNTIKKIKNKHQGTIAIIIGPHGEQSGKSMLGHSTLNDFIFKLDAVKPKGAKELKLPYYAYFPSFLLEEEISQALFLAGKSPNYKADNMQMTVWLIEK